MDKKIPLKYICKNCGLGFLGKNPRHKYKFCSLKCFYEYIRPVYQCENCGKIFSKYNRIGAHKFCSIKCFGEWRKKNSDLNCECVFCSRKFHKRKSQIGIINFCSQLCRDKYYKRKCLNCGKLFTIDKINRIKFCSYECYQEFRIKNLSGSYGPWVCPECHKIFSRYFSPQHDRPFHFCSSECRYLWMQKERHPLWQGGVSNQPYAFSFDEKLKDIIKERDGFCCQVCGSQEDLCVHHINYKKLDSSEENLITLCHSCHSKTNGNRSFWIDYFRRNHESNRSKSA